ncbi:MAG TPA: NAD-dependent epimerase/dehydratase family protein [Candidatus Acidoferrum sp.]|nr:NAD-dependent epimerase/dehydratase family protein [Candidatus Acidoferrum sp.]
MMQDNFEANKGLIKGKRILVTGAGGFVGGHLARELHRQGNFVRAVDVKWDGFIDNPYYSESMTLDLREPENAIKAVGGMDYVFDLAANVGGMAWITKIAAEIMRDNQRININLLEACRKNDVERVFFSSSACVYPYTLQETTDSPKLKESDVAPYNPDTFYGWEKLLMEKECEAYANDYGLVTRIARFHTIYGEGSAHDGVRDKVPSALCRKVIQASDGGSIEIWGDGKQTRSFLYVSDCVEGVISLMASNCKEPLNIGSDKLITIDALADMVIGMSGKKLNKRYDLTKPQGVRGRCADITLAKKILGWTPKIPLEEGMSRTYHFVEGLLKNNSLKE